MGAASGKEVIWFCSAPRTDERAQLAETCYAWWKSQNVNLELLTPKILGCDNREFNRLRRKVADQGSTGKFYVLTDDDCLPIGNWKELAHRAAWTAELRPDFGVLSFWPMEASIQRWTPENYQTYEDLEVSEHVSVGGLRWCQTESILYWPPIEEIGYDLIQADRLRSIGKRVGYFQHLRCNHLGEGKTDLWAKEVCV